MNDFASRWTRITIRHPRPIPTQRLDIDGNGPDRMQPGEHQHLNRRSFTPLSLRFREPVAGIDAKTSTINWAPKFQLTIQNHRQSTVDDRRSHSEFNAFRNSYHTRSWKPVSRAHRKGGASPDEHTAFKSVRRSRSVETWDINRVDRVYRSPRVDTATSAIVVPGRSSSSKPKTPTPPIDMNKLDNELWNRFEKRIRIDRERRGKG